MTTKPKRTLPRKQVFRGQLRPGPGYFFAKFGAGEKARVHLLSGNRLNNAFRALCSKHLEKGQTLTRVEQATADELCAGCQREFAMMYGKPQADTPLVRVAV